MILLILIELKYGDIDKDMVFLYFCMLFIDGIVAVALIRDIGANMGSIELFSVLSKYMKKGLASSLLRYCEFILTEMKKTKLRMQVVLSDYYDRNSIMKLGYLIESEERWTEQNTKLKPEILRSYKLVTLSKNL